MASVFVVQYVDSRDNGDEDVKMVGVYSSRDKAEKAVKRLSLQPGFANATDGFSVDEYRVDQDQWAVGFVELASA